MSMFRSDTHQITSRRATQLGVASVILFAGLTALTSRITIPLPFSVVPITLQTLAVVLSGLVLGRRGGALSQAAYLAAIAAGLPLSASGIGGAAAFLTPTAGYLVAFVPAAYFTGYLAEGGSDRGGLKLRTNLLAGVIGMLVIYAGGVFWLSVVLGDVATAIQQGLLPFVGVDLGKAVIAALVASGGRRILMPAA